VPKGTVFVVDDDPGIRRSLELLLDSVGLEVSCFASTTEFLDAYDPDAPGCLLLDVRLPTISGLALQEQLRTMHSMLPIIFITAHGDVPLAVRAMHAGAFDFLEKPFNDQELIDRTQAALEHDAKNRQQLGRHEEILVQLGRLTAREREVMEHVVNGQANKVIAHELGISERTVEIHRSRVMEKMHASSLAQLVRMWLAVND
jgi:FixJ family two-component response regulator